MAGWAQGYGQLELCMGTPHNPGENPLISVPLLHISVTTGALSVVGRCCSTEVCRVTPGWAQDCVPCHW